MHPQDTTVPEEWRPVPGYEGWYSVSNLGRVRRDCGGRGARANRLCKPQPDTKGYLRVALVIDAKHRNYAVHRLVATAFLRSPEPGEQVNHLNGIKGDNRVENLEWCTQVENMAHAWSQGLKLALKGQLNGRAKVTDRQVEQIRRLRGLMSQRAIGTLYGLSQSQVSAIQLGVSRSR